MDPEQSKSEPPPPLAYAEPAQDRRTSWPDVVGHVLFGVGVALVFGGYMGRDYRWSSFIGDLLMQYYPHVMMAGGFLCGLLISLRLGPFPR
jgi:hypothetical protein